MPSVSGVHLCQKRGSCIATASLQLTAWAVNGNRALCWFALGAFHGEKGARPSGSDSSRSSGSGRRYSASWPLNRR